MLLKSVAACAGDAAMYMGGSSRRSGTARDARELSAIGSVKFAFLGTQPPTVTVGVGVPVPVAVRVPVTDPLAVTVVVCVGDAVVDADSDVDREGVLGAEGVTDGDAPVESEADGVSDDDGVVEVDADNVAVVVLLEVPVGELVPVPDPDSVCVGVTLVVSERDVVDENESVGVTDGLAPGDSDADDE